MGVSVSVGGAVFVGSGVLVSEGISTATSVVNETAGSAAGRQPNIKANQTVNKPIDRVYFSKASLLFNTS